MITLQEVIEQVQIAGAMKYPYLKKVKVNYLENIFTNGINYSSQYLLKILLEK
jgi:hypothetical protein